jgi:hypothetical protein
MLVKLLGAFDVLFGVVLLFFTGFNIPTSFLFAFGVIAMTKSSFGLLKDIGSWIDFATGTAFFFMMITGIPMVLSALAGVLVFQKGIFSFL